MRHQRLAPAHQPLQPVRRHARPPPRRWPSLVRRCIWPARPSGSRRSPPRPQRGRPGCRPRGCDRPGHPGSPAGCRAPCPTPMNFQAPASMGVSARRAPSVRRTTRRRTSRRMSSVRRRNTLSRACMDGTEGVAFGAGRSEVGKHRICSEQLAARIHDGFRPSPSCRRGETPVGNQIDRNPQSGQIVVWNRRRPPACLSAGRSSRRLLSRWRTLANSISVPLDTCRWSAICCEPAIGIFRSEGYHEQRASPVWPARLAGLRLASCP